MASSWFFSIFALESAKSTTGIIFFWCALEANSGTTPPYFLWTSWLAIIFDNILLSLIIAAEVSSQDDSIPNIVTGTIFVFYKYNVIKYQKYFFK